MHNGGAAREDDSMFAPTDDTPRLDEERLEGFRDLQDENGNVIQGIIRVFVAQTAEWLAAAAHSCLAGDLTALRFIAHMLKGTCGTMGAARMHAWASELEYAIDASDTSTVSTSVQALTEEFGPVVTLLEEYARRIGTPRAGI